MKKRLGIVALATAGMSITIFVGFRVFAFQLHGRLAWTNTGSMPTGLYDISGSGAQQRIPIGTIAIACPTLREVAVESRVESLRGDGCPSGIGAIIKVVVASAGDVVAVRGCGIIVGARLLIDSKPLSRAPKDPSAQWQRRLAAGEAMLWSPHPRSDDSRYWGPYRPFAVAQPVATASYPFDIRPRFLSATKTRRLCTA